jgi:hypothetical protein
MLGEGELVAVCGGFDGIDGLVGAAHAVLLARYLLDEVVRDSGFELFVQSVDLGLKCGVFGLELTGLRVVLSAPHEAVAVEEEEPYPPDGEADEQKPASEPGGSEQLRDRARHGSLGGGGRTGDG